MVQFNLIIICLILLCALNFSHSSSAVKKTESDLPKGLIDLTAGDKPCFCPTKWGGILPSSICGKEIIKLSPNSDCKPEYTYQCSHTGDRAQAVELCPNEGEGILCGPVRPESFKFEYVKNKLARARDCSSKKQLKGWILEVHNGDYTAWKYVGV